MIEMTVNPPTQAGWYWVWYYGYEYPEVVMLNHQGDLYGCGTKEKVNPKSIFTYSREKLEAPVNVW